MRDRFAYHMDRINDVLERGNAGDRGAVPVAPSVAARALHDALVAGGIYRCSADGERFMSDEIATDVIEQLAARGFCLHLMRKKP